MTSRWLFAVVVALVMSIGTARAGSIKQVEDDMLYETMDSGHIKNDGANFQEALRNAMVEAKQKAMAEQNAIDEKNVKDNYSPHSLHYGARMNPALKEGCMEEKIMENGIRKVAKDLGYSKEQVSALYGQELSNEIKKLIGCGNKKKPVCDENTPFRSLDGTCNNLKNPSYGSTNTPFDRLVRPDYGDGIGTPRLAKDGTKLPNARAVSFTAFSDVDRPSKTLSHLSMIWGQFLDHDITLGAHPDVECNGPCIVPGTDCFGIPIPAGDPHFPAQGVTCIRMIRDAAAAPRNCKLGPREQVNTLTAFIDASMVYGADPVIAARERDLDSDLGLMKETRNPNGYNFLPLLPQVNDPNCSPDAGSGDQCFTSGDVRVNENPGLMTMQTLWVREHNRIARRLKELTPCMKGEQIYQIARKIVGAEIQHITLTEYLPHILDTDTRQKNKLIPLSSGFFRGYDPTVDPTISNSFAGAAYRFGHSMVRNTFSRFSPSPHNRKFDDIQTKNFGNPSPLYDVCNGGVDAIFRGLFKDPAQNVDGFFSKAIQENLVREAGDLSDLVALNIQRGRERGIRGYNSFRKVCGLPTFSTFDGFLKVLPKNVVDAVKKLYKHPDDVDLWVGGISEKLQPGHTLGPTFACIIGRQFGALRAGDRFWYETGDPVTGFTPEQLSEIRKVTLASVICNNSDSIRQIAKEVLHITSETISCADVPKMDLRQWKNAHEEGGAAGYSAAGEGEEGSAGGYEAGYAVGA